MIESGLFSVSSECGRKEMRVGPYRYLGKATQATDTTDKLPEVCRAEEEQIR